MEYIVQRLHQLLQHPQELTQSRSVRFIQQKVKIQATLVLGAPIEFKRTVRYDCYLIISDMYFMCVYQTVSLPLSPPHSDAATQLMEPFHFFTQVVTVINLVVRTSQMVCRLQRSNNTWRVIDRLLTLYGPHSFRPIAIMYSHTLNITTSLHVPLMCAC
jgi:hypothetical protein